MVNHKRRTSPQRPPWGQVKCLLWGCMGAIGHLFCFVLFFFEGATLILNSANCSIIHIIKTETATDDMRKGSNFLTFYNRKWGFVDTVRQPLINWRLVERLL